MCNRKPWTRLCGGWLLTASEIIGGCGQRPTLYIVLLANNAHGDLRRGRLAIQFHSRIALIVICGGGGQPFCFIENNARNDLRRQSVLCDASEDNGRAIAEMIPEVMTDAGIRFSVFLLLENSRVIIDALSATGKKERNGNQSGCDKGVALMEPVAGGLRWSQKDGDVGSRMVMLAEGWRCWRKKGAVCG